MTEKETWKKLLKLTLFFLLHLENNNSFFVFQMYFFIIWKSAETDSLTTKYVPVHFEFVLFHLTIYELIEL